MDVSCDARALHDIGVELLATFGSRVAGHPRPTSDVDVGVVFADHRWDPSRLDAVAQAVHAEAEVDLVPLDGADPLLLREAALDGRPLYADPPSAWEEFRVRAFKQFWEARQFRDLETEALRRRFG